MLVSASKLGYGSSRLLVAARVIAQEACVTETAVLLVFWYRLREEENPTFEASIACAATYSLTLRVPLPLFFYRSRTALPIYCPLIHNCKPIDRAAYSAPVTRVRGVARTSIPDVSRQASVPYLPCLDTLKYTDPLASYASSLSMSP